MIEQADRVVMAATTALRRTVPEEQGVSSSALLNLYNTLDREIHDMHSVMVLRRGAVVSEGWWAPYRPDLPHMMFSLSKSFTSTAAGLAIDDGLLSLDDTVVGFFPEELPSAPNKNLAALRVRDLLTMTTGNAEDTLSALFRSSSNDWVKAFLGAEFPYFPGTHFVYNSGASYMLSAIVQKRTGMRILDYLQPRLLEPLGIVDATWEASPQGVNTGGWGLTLKTEDIARFGQLYLQRGVWNGKRILPDAWVREATSKQVPNGENPESDWAQGYGFQFWQSRHGAYRGDGACGQFCIVIPDQDVVVAITAGTNDLQTILDILWQTLLPGLAPERITVDHAANAELNARLSALEIRPPEGTSSSEVADTIYGKKFRFDSNENRIADASIRRDGADVAIQITDAYGSHTVDAGLNGGWTTGRTALNTPGYPMSAGQTRGVVASGAWTSAGTFRAKLCFVKTPFAATLKFRFDGDQLFLDIHGNAGFGPLEWEQLKGRAAK